MADNDSSTRSRELGAEMRKRRQAKGWTASFLADELGWSASKVSRMENGSRGVSEVDAAIYLTFCDVRKSEVYELLDLILEDDEDDTTWLQEHGQRLPDELRTLIFHENTAETIASYEPLGVPGLLQTEDYARTVFEFAGLVGKDRIGHAVRARMDRQTVLRRREPPQCQFFIHENGLRETVGSARIMQDQLLHLVFLTGRPQYGIRVVPAGTGHYGAWFGPFRVMGYRTHGDVAYAEGLSTSVFLEKQQHIDEYRRVLRRLDEAALSVGESREWLARLASEFDTAGEGV